jgi:hypothetical protein
MCLPSRSVSCSSSSSSSMHKPSMGAATGQGLPPATGNLSSISRCASPTSACVCPQSLNWAARRHLPQSQMLCPRLQAASMQLKGRDAGHMLHPPRAPSSV